MKEQKSNLLVIIKTQRQPPQKCGGLAFVAACSDAGDVDEEEEENKKSTVSSI